MVVCTAQDQLKDKGDAVDLMVLVELLERHILPLANLVADKSTIDYSEAEEREVHREVCSFGPVTND
jgi:hypothetical protein